MAESSDAPHDEHAVPSDEAASDEAASDEAASDEAASDEAASGDLTLPEALLMLALGDEDGKVAIDNTKALPVGLAAAVLLTLAARERLRHEDEVWVVADDAPTGDGALDEALRTIADDEEPRDTLHWLRTLPDAGEESLRDRLLHRLVEKDVLQEKKHRFLGVFSHPRYPTEDPDPEKRVRERVRQVVLEDETPDDLILSLVALMDACNLTKEVFEAKERTGARRRLDDLTRIPRVARALTSVDPETTNAVLDATTAATLAATRTGL